MLLIGKNGAGKTTTSLALQILQKIARGTNQVRHLIEPKDLARGRIDVPVRFEIDVELDSKSYQYAIAFEYPAGFKELRVFEEKLSVDGVPIYTRELAQVRLARFGKEKQADFRIDWHLVALPVIQEQSMNDPIFVIKQWLARMLLFRPIPSLIKGGSTEETLQPNENLADFAAWFSGLLAYAPSAYSTIDAYLKQVMPDIKDIKNPTVGKDSRSLVVQFSNGHGNLILPFEELSDGEKCFMICALALASNEAYGPLFCFWDEPDNFLALSEVSHFVMALRRTFLAGGQFIATSHNPEAIRSFSDENTFVLQRENHLEPTRVRPLSELNVTGDLISALILGEVG